MTPQGAILARPASIVHAGEERQVARRLADLGIPILKTLTGNATFEGADLMRIDENTAMISRGPRTNAAGIEQTRALLGETGSELLEVDIPSGTRYFMGMFRIADRDLAICWTRRTPHHCVQVLRERGYEVAFPPLQDDYASHRGINCVTLGPRRILMVDGLPRIQSYYERLGIESLKTPTAVLASAAGNVGCLTSILHRERAN